MTNNYCKGCPGEHEEVWDCGECGLEKPIVYLDTESQFRDKLKQEIRKC